jgi:hypothetical protein
VVARIVKALEFYRELSGGHYPRHRIVYGDVVRDEMLAMAGIDNPPRPEQISTKRYGQYLDGCRGMTDLACTLRDNEDAVYFGLTVVPKDKGKVLFRWRLEDGRYQVIFGDLRDEIMDRGRLEKLEAE